MTTTLGLISDTHFQDRLFELPPQLNDLFAGAALILHAGDVGEISVLNSLSRLAPVVAVHGNDEPEYVQQWLPSQQIVSVHGLRLLLCHSHYPDREEELSKRGGPWGPKLDRIAGLGRAVGASLVVYGHSHVPFVYRCDGVTLVNPGAIASGSYFTRQVRPSVARLEVADDGAFTITYLELATGQPVTFPAPDPAEEFGMLAQQYQEAVVAPELLPITAALRKIQYEDVRRVVRAFAPVYRRYVHGGLMQREEWIEAIRAGVDITPNDRARVLAVLEP